MVIVILAVLLLSSASFVFDGTALSAASARSNTNINTPDSTGSGYSVTFVESGLPAGNAYQWGVVFDNITERSSASTIVFNVPDGHYGYTVESTFNYYPITPNGQVTVKGSNKIVNVDFGSKTYLVTFSVSNYATVRGSSGSYNTWSVTFDGMRNTTQSDSVNYYIQNGTYAYTISAPFGYSSSPASGNLTVNGSNVMLGLTFNSTYFQVTFTESGLPVTSVSKLVPEWRIEISGNSIPSTMNLTSYNSVITISLPVGQYNYTVIDPNGYYSTPSRGNFTVSHSSISDSIVFTPLYYNLVFSEKGLPSTSQSGAYGTEWGVKIVDTASHASYTQYTSGADIYFYADNGTYNYYVLNLTDYSASLSSGSVTVNGYNYLVPVQFTSKYAVITFSESGLPMGASQYIVAQWSITLVSQANGATTHSSSNTTTLSFNVLPGSYNYAVKAVAGYSTSSPSGSVSVTTSATVTEQFTSTASFYKNSVVSAMTFVEQGLPANTKWTVTLTSSTGSQSYSSIYQNNVIYANEGLYVYTVSSIGPYSPQKSSGLINSTSVSTKTIYFTNVFHPLVFKETGLPYNTTWSVLLQYPSGLSKVVKSSTGSISFSVPNGTYFYRIVDTGNYHPSNSQGIITVEGTTYTPSGTTTIRFHNSMTVVSISETGLPAYSKWTVSLLYPGGSLVTKSTTYGSMDYVVPNGTYRFFAYSVGFYDPSEISSTIIATGSAASISLSFVNHVQVISFNEKGLPAGTSWSVVLGSNSAPVYSATGSNITFSVGNGSHYFMIQPSGNYQSSITSGMVYVSTANSIINVTFQKRFYTVSVKETGLVLGTPWSITFGGKLYSSTGNTITINKENGSYIYSMTSTSSFFPSPSDGLQIVAGNNPQINVNFKSDLYTVTFTTSGLPLGVLWGVVLSNSQEHFSNLSGSITFEVSNGSYSFSVQSSNHYIPSPATGTVEVSGNAVSITLTFKIYRYSVTFHALSGLPSGDTWYVNVTSSTGSVYTQSSTSDMISINLLNGTYSYHITSANKSVASLNHGLLIVQGANQEINVQFALVAYTVTFRESGLPQNTTWYVIVNGQNKSVVSGQFSLTLQNGSYSYTVINIQGYNATENTGVVTVKGSNTTVLVTYQPVSKTWKVTQPTTNNPVPLNNMVIYILIGVGAVGLIVLFVVYSRGRRK